MAYKIRLKNLKRYLESKHWSISEFNRKAYKVSLSMDGQDYNTLIPSNEELPDYEIIIEKFIEFLGSVEQREYTKIIDEIENVGYDAKQPNATADKINRVCGQYHKMGADFVSFIVTAPKTKEIKFVETKNYIIKNINKIIRKTGVKNCFHDLKKENIAGRLISAVDEVERAWNGKARDSTVIEHKGDKLLITGSMSFGDDPTETFTNLSLLDEAGLLYFMGFN